MSLRKFILGVLFVVAVCCTWSQVIAQTAPSYAPLVFYNVPNFYSGNFQWQRYATPTDAFSIPWPEPTAPCPNSAGGQLLFLYAYSVQSYGYPPDALYGAEYHSVNCATGEQYTGPYYSDARQWAYCGGDPNDMGNYTYSPSSFPNGVCPPPSGASPNKNHGNSGCHAHCFGEPINAGTANKFEHKLEYEGTGPFPLKVEWDYVTPNVNQTTPPQNLMLGSDRILSYQRSIQVYKAPTLLTAYVARPDGNTFHFTLIGSTWTPDPDVDGTLSSTQDSQGNITGWSYLNRDGEIEGYDASGVLKWIQNKQGFVQTLAYNSSGQLASVTDPLGRTLTFQYNAAGQIGTITEPDGGQLQFGYDTNPYGGAVPVNLQTVTYPDGNKRTYVYGESANTAGTGSITALTGIVDENGKRYSTTQYNASGQAIATFFGSGIGTESATYTASGDRSYQGTAVVTKALGETQTVTNTVLFGTINPVQIVSSCASGCTTRTETYGYDAYGRLNKFTDFNGNTTSYTHDPKGLETQRIEGQGTPSQRTINTSWDTGLRSPLERTVLDASGTLTAKTDWVYNARGQVLARCEDDPTVSGATSYLCSNTGTPPAGVRRWTYTYCDAVDGTQCPLVGLLLSVDGPRTDVPDVTQYSYYLTTDDSGCATVGGACHHAGDLATVTDALGHVTQTVSYDKDGRPTETTDANGVVTTFAYTPRGWLHTKSVAGATTTIDYDAVGNVIKVTQPDGVFTSYTYDDAHRLIGIADALGNHIDYTLDAAGNRTAENTYAAGSSTPSRSLSRQYNTLGQLVKDLDAYSHATTYAYDPNGNRTDATDPLGITTHSSYDALNRLAQTIQNYQGSDPATQNTTTSYAYDSQDNLTQVTDPDSLNTQYTYDGLNDLGQLQSPDTGTSSYTYDSAGNRISQTDARGVVSTYSYDALNRLTAVGYPISTLNVHYYYDEPNSTTGCASSYPIGRLTRMTDISGTTKYCYDSHGNVVKKTQTVTNGAGTTTAVITYAWNLADRLTSVTYPNGFALNYGRDADGRIVSIAPPSPPPGPIEYYCLPGSPCPPPQGSVATPIITGISYLPFGPAAKYAFASGGQVLTKTYDANYRATDIVGGSALNLHFVLDATGDITAEGNASGVATPNETYQYDPLYRLQQVDDATGAPWQSYNYDKTGDRLSKTTAGQISADTYNYTSGTHRLIGISGYDSSSRAFDANGNTSALQANGWMYGLGYDNTNRLTLVQQNGTTAATYQLNGRGERVGKVANGVQTAYVYDESGKLLFEEGATNRAYIWADDTLVAIQDSSTGTQYVYTDHLGTPRAVTNTTSSTPIWTWPWLQNPFGERPASGAGGYTLNLRFPGQYFDAEDGLMYNGNRDYLAGDGRYIESDPIGLDGGISTYAYAKSNPYVFKDFDGRSVTCDAYSCTISAGDSLLELGIDYLTVEAIKLQREIENERLQRKQCPRDDSHCEELYQVDTQTCNAITRKRGRMAGEACHRSATERYGACLAGRPIPPLNTWNN